MSDDSAPVAGETVEDPFVAVLAAHVPTSTAGMAGRSRPHFWMCACRVYGHGEDGHRAHVAAALRARETAPAEATGLRERMVALADRWQEVMRRTPGQSDERETYGDGYANGLATAIIDLRRLAVEAAGRDEQGQS